ncbi:MAG: hypothetical protein EBU90_26670 [Proteobacteria bacterium]|nr:hypothetical protein [Pseudomonadota bacterium]
MNKANLIKTLTLLGKLAAGAGAFSGSLDPKTAAIVFVVSSILKDVTSTLTNFLGGGSTTQA